MVPMDKDIVDKKSESLIHYLTFLVYFGLFYFKHNFLFILTNGTILHFIKGDIIKKLFTFFAAGFSSWAFHYLAHQYVSFNAMSGHRNHHKPKTTILEDVHEFVSNVGAAGFVLLVLHSILKQYKVSIFNSYVLGLFMIAFPLVHLCIYHRVLKKSYHEEHHTDPKANFSPDFFDHLFWYQSR